MSSPSLPAMLLRVARPLLSLAAVWLLATPAGAQAPAAKAASSATDADVSVTLAQGETRRVPLALSAEGHAAPAAVERVAVQTFLEDFEDGDNPYGLTLGIPQAETIEPSGGNPGRWLRNDVLDTFIPRLTARVPPFSGDFVARGARSIRLDAQTLAASFGVPGRPFTLVLTTFNGQPNNPNAYDYVYTSGGLAPQVGQGWSSYAYPIPSRFSGELPAGWTGGYAGDPENLRPGVVWQDILSDVDEVAVWWGSPAFFYIGQQFDLGVDNVRIDYLRRTEDAATTALAVGPAEGAPGGRLGLTVDAADLEVGVHTFAVHVPAADASAPASVLEVQVRVTPAVAQAATAAEDAVVLFQNAPNPFSGSTTVTFSVPRATPVVLDVIDGTGRRVRHLADGVFEAGRHRVAWPAENLPAGVYTVRLPTDQTVQVRRAAVVR